MKGKGGHAGNRPPPMVIKSPKTQAEGNAIVSINPFVVLSTADEQNSLILEEGEVQQYEVQEEELEAIEGLWFLFHSV